MTIEGKVVKAFCEERDLVGKDGVKKHMKASRVLIMTDEPEMLSCVSYDENFVLPKVGDLHYKTPPIKKYENYRGMVAEVIF